MKSIAVVIVLAMALILLLSTGLSCSMSAGVVQAYSEVSEAGYELIYDSMMGTVSCVHKLSDNTFIPLDAGNADFQEFLSWNAEQPVPLDLTSTIELPISTPPKSMHVAALKSVAMVSGSPRATVYRLYQGRVYEILNCRVSQTAYDSYLAAKIKVYNPAYNWQAPENKDCFVLVYFISETPYGTEIDIPVIIDKVIK